MDTAAASARPDRGVGLAAGSGSGSRAACATGNKAARKKLKRATARCPPFSPAELAAARQPGALRAFIDTLNGMTSALSTDMEGSYSALRRALRQLRGWSQLATRAFAAAYHPSPDFSNLLTRQCHCIAIVWAAANADLLCADVPTRGPTQPRRRVGRGRGPTR